VDGARPAPPPRPPEGAPFRDAEAWLAERGVEREPIRPSPTDDASPPGGTDVSVREAVRLAEASADLLVQAVDAAAGEPDRSRPGLEDDVARALAFVRRSTSAAPQSEARVRAKLSEQGWPSVVVDRALERARAEGLVDDAAMVAALVDERRRRGHAPARIRRDLAERGFDRATLEAALAVADAEDPEAAAFAVARDKATRTTGLPAEAAFRRVVGHVARRGYPEGLARRVARQAVFTARDDDRTVGH